MEKILAKNVKYFCMLRKKKLKELAVEIGIDPATLTRAIHGNARLDTIEKIAKALDVSVKELFESTDNNRIEGYIKYEKGSCLFNGKQELFEILSQEIMETVAVVLSGQLKIIKEIIKELDSSFNSYDFITKYRDKSPSSYINMLFKHQKDEDPFHVVHAQIAKFLANCTKNKILNISYIEGNVMNIINIHGRPSKVQIWNKIETNK